MMIAMVIWDTGTENVKSEKTNIKTNSRVVGVRVSIRARFFFFSHHPDPFWGPPSLLSNGYGGLFPLA
jgi:hypothetical protein